MVDFKRETLNKSKDKTVCWWILPQLLLKPILSCFHEKERIGSTSVLAVQDFLQSLVGRDITVIGFLNFMFHPKAPDCFWVLKMGCFQGAPEGSGFFFGIGGVIRLPPSIFDTADTACIHMRLGHSTPFCLRLIGMVTPESEI